MVDASYVRFGCFGTQCFGDDDTPAAFRLENAGNITLAGSLKQAFKGADIVLVSSNISLGLGSFSVTCFGQKSCREMSVDALGYYSRYCMRHLILCSVT